MDILLLAIGFIGVVTWVWQWQHPPQAQPESIPPERKYPLPPRPKNDDPGRWYG